MNLNTLFSLDLVYLISTWFLFGAFHSILASRYVKEKAKRYFPLLFDQYRMVYNGIALLTFMLVMAYGFSLSGEWLFQPSVIWEFIGLMFATYGLLIIRVAMKSYGWREFLGLEEESGQRMMERTLKQSGLLGYIRHPLYTGIILIFIGVFFYLPSFVHLVNLGCVIAYILVGVHFEERRLIATFGKEYQDYRDKVPALFPSLR